MLFKLENSTDVAIIKKYGEGRTIGLTSGVFDLLHYLHHIYLEKCRRQCDILLVGVDSDRLVKQSKGVSRPLIPESQRAEMVNALSNVGGVFIMDSLFDWEAAISNLDVDFIFKNDQFNSEEIITKDSVEVVIIPDVTAPNSTTEIVEECIRRQNSPMEK